MKVPAQLQALLEATGALDMLNELESMVGGPDAKVTIEGNKVRKEWSSPDNSFRVVVEETRPEESPEKNIDQLVNDLLVRPIFVLGSVTFGDLGEVQEYLSDLFIDGLLDPLTAVYHIENPGESFYVVSHQEYDSREEAVSALGEMHQAGELHPNTGLYKTDLAHTYELDILLTPAKA